MSSVNKTSLSVQSAPSPTPPPSHPPSILPPGIYPAIIDEVSKPKRRWGGRTVIRVRFWLNPPEGPLVAKWITLDYRHPGSALRRICALLVGSPNANFRALVKKSCLVEIVHCPGKKHPVIMLPVRIGRADDSGWVPLGYGFSEEEPKETVKE